MENSSSLTIRCQNNLNECLVGDFRGWIYHLQNVIRIIVMPKKQQTIWQMIDAIVWNLKISRRDGTKVNNGVHY